MSFWTLRISTTTGHLFFRLVPTAGNSPPEPAVGQLPASLPLPAASGPDAPVARHGHGPADRVIRAGRAGNRDAIRDIPISRRDLGRLGNSLTAAPARSLTEPSTSAGHADDGSIPACRARDDAATSLSTPADARSDRVNASSSLPPRGQNDLGGFGRANPSGIRAPGGPDLSHPALGRGSDRTPGFARGTPRAITDQPEPIPRRRRRSGRAERQVVARDRPSC
jgi:hypothetical protein